MMKMCFFLFMVLVLFTPAAIAAYVCPDGTYVNQGPCKLCPDGSYIGSDVLCQIVVNESYGSQGLNDANVSNRVKEIGQAENLSAYPGSLPNSGAINSSNNVGDLSTTLIQGQREQLKADQRIIVAYNEYLRGKDHKAFAYSNDGFAGWCVMQKTQKEAQDCAVLNCEQYRQPGQKGSCNIWAFDETVVGWRDGGGSH